MKVFVLVKGESYDGSEVVGVFYTLEVAKTVAESDAPSKRFEWNEDGPGCWYVSPYNLSGSRCFYSIEEFEVRDK